LLRIAILPRLTLPGKYIYNKVWINNKFKVSWSLEYLELKDKYLKYAYYNY